MTARVLIGAAQIAAYLGISRGRVYALVANKGLPVYRIYTTICARAATIDAWIQRQEDEALKPRGAHARLNRRQGQETGR